MTTEHSRRPRGDIGIGDLARVLVELDLERHEHLQLASRSLGFEGMVRGTNRHPQAAAEKRMRRSPMRKREQNPDRRHFAPPAPARPPQPSGEVLTSQLIPKPRPTEPERPDWLDGRPSPRADIVPPRRVPLLTRNRAAGIIKAAVRVRRPGRRLDVSRLIRFVIERRPLDALPRLPVGGLENGVDLVCDYGESMQPFHADLQMLADSFSSVLGTQGCRVYEYDGNPNRALTWSTNDEPISWTPTASRPVVLATDFGRGNPNAIAQRLQRPAWRDFVRQLSMAGAPLVAFTPLRPVDLPRWLGARIKIVHWDPRTRAGAVSRLVGVGHEPRR